MKARQFTNFFFALLFLGTGVFAAVFLYRDYQHYDTLRTENIRLSKRHAELASEKAEKDHQLKELEGNTEYMEKTVRQKLHYAKEDETIFRFEN